MKTNICIAISTYKRKKNLVNLLKSIQNLKNKKYVNLKIFIIINDMINYNFLNKLFKHRLKIKLIQERNKGLSFTRNRALKELKKEKCEYIVFFDDDCIVGKYWLVEMLALFKKINPDIIGGPQISCSRSSYIRLLERREKHARNINWVSTNNVIMKSKVLLKNINFSKKLNLIGGEDQLFFLKLKKSGYKIIWNENAKVFEVANKDRENLIWFIKRNLRYGLSSKIIFIESYGLFLGIVMIFIKFNIDISKATFYLIFFLFNFKKNFLKFIMYFFRSLGVILSIFGFQIKEYSK